MTEPAYHRYITAAARRVLALCCREGWPALATKVSINHCTAWAGILV